MKKIRSYTSIWSVEKVLYSINDFKLPFPITFTQMAWFVVSVFAVMLLGNLPPLSFIDGAFLKYFGVPFALTWFMCQKTFDGKEALRLPKIRTGISGAPETDLCRKAREAGKSNIRHSPSRQLGVIFMAYPIKYIENNLVFNHDGECFAYYELLPYNYSFLSPEQKYQVHDSFRQLIAQNRDGKIHALQISTESSIRAAQERSKQEVTGKLKDIACTKIDAQTEALISMIGENQVDYRFFIGFKLLVNEQEVTMKQFRREAKTAVSDFLHEVNHKLMGDFVSMSNEEIWRFQKMEKLLESKISRRFKVRRLDKDDFGYLIEHLYGQTGTAYEDYEYYLPKKRFQEETLVKYYDLIKPTRCLIEENQRYLKIEQEDGTVYAAYFTINSIVGELDFPSSEIFYYQQQQFTFSH